MSSTIFETASGSTASPTYKLALMSIFFNVKKLYFLENLELTSPVDVLATPTPGTALNALIVVDVHNVRDVALRAKRPIMAAGIVVSLCTWFSSKYCYGMPIEYTNFTGG